MKTGIIRRIDDLGRVVIPKNVRELIGITEGTPLEISVEGGKICLEKYTINNYAETLKTILDNVKHSDLIGDDKKRNICVALKNVIDIIREG